MATSASSLPTPARILVVDDEPDLRTLYELTLLRAGYLVDSAADLTQAREYLFHNNYDVMITDMRLPDGLGLELLQEIKAKQRSERCIVMTAYGSAENAVESLKAGAFDYLTKPVDLKQFRAVVASALQKTTSSHKDEAASETVITPASQRALDRMVGESASMRAVKQRIIKVAPSMAPVLVRGESGTGKELVARALHSCSHRSEGPLVAVNCGAIPENLLEAEFFGARKGSYTGAQQDREGYFQAAHGGTLFLDEIGDLPLQMQSKLLRAIQERCIRPLGATQEISVDVRIVSATHKDLAADVLNGKFRQDLYYRLNVIEIIVPPLRERKEDLPLLCEALLARIATESAQTVPPLSARALEKLYEEPLSGNIRELENLLHRALALSDGSELSFDHDSDSAPNYGTVNYPVDTQAAVAARAAILEAPFGIKRNNQLNQTHSSENSRKTPFRPFDGIDRALSESEMNVLVPDELPYDLQNYLDELERRILKRALEEKDFNRTAVSNRLGLSLRQIRYRIERLNIEVPRDKEEEETKSKSKSEKIEKTDKLSDQELLKKLEKDLEKKLEDMKNSMSEDLPENPLDPI